jgi:hypothetical protein
MLRNAVRKRSCGGKRRGATVLVMSFVVEGWYRRGIVIDIEYGLVRCQANDADSLLSFVETGTAYQLADRAVEVED